MTQEYGNNPSYYSRFNLSLRNGGRGHEGLDFGCPFGTPVKAAQSGVIRYAGWLGNYGYYVGLQAYDGSGTGYCHLSSFAVSAGQNVTEGQVIAYVGSTGNSSGPHLHFNYYKQYGVWVYDDPNELFSKGGTIDPQLKDYAVSGRFWMFTNREASRSELTFFRDLSMTEAEDFLRHKSTEYRDRINDGWRLIHGRNTTDEEFKKLDGTPVALVYAQLLSANQNIPAKKLKDIEAIIRS